MLPEQLSTLNVLLQKAGDTVMQMLDLLINIVKTENIAKELKNEMESFENNLNKLEVEISQHTIVTLALYQPEAKLLRFVISSMHINQNLERMGDMAINIIERLLKILSSDKDIAYQNKLSEMLTDTKLMINEGLQSFIEENEEMARELFKKDDKVDEMRDLLLEKLTDKIKGAGTQSVDDSLNEIIIVQNIERIADMATTIAKNTIFYINGTLAEHSRLKL